MASKIGMDGGGDAESGTVKGNQISPEKEGACGPIPSKSDEEMALLQQQPEASGFYHHHGKQHGPEQLDSDAVEFFKATLIKKKNIYSMEPIPLSTPWTFWIDRTARGVKMDQYEANLNKIYTAYTVYRFWQVYQNVPPPSDLNCRSSIHMMRDERKPVWEEAYNCKGGTFRFYVQKKYTDKVWKEMLLATIGEQLNAYLAKGDEVCGVSVSIRDMEDVVLVWNTNAEVASQAKLFECVRLLLPDTKFLSTFYKEHPAFEKSARKEAPRK